FISQSCPNLSHRLNFLPVFYSNQKLPDPKTGPLPFSFCISHYNTINRTTQLPFRCFCLLHLHPSPPCSPRHILTTRFFNHNSLQPFFNFLLVKPPDIFR